MPTPSTRTPVRIARGSYSNLNSSLSDLQDGEIVYAEDQDKLYVKEGSSLVGVTVPSASPTFTGDVTFTGASSNGIWDASANAFVANLTGNVTGDATGSAATVTGAAQSAITSLGTLTGLTISGDLFLDNGSTAGRDILWDVSDNALKVSDDTNINLGTGNDLKLYTNGSNSYIQHNGDGDLWIEAQGADENIWIRAKDDVYIQTNASDNSAKFITGGAVELYHANSKKVETTSTGIDVTGTAVVDGITIDGAYEQVAEAVGALEIDCSAGNYFTKTISGNSTFTFANPAASGSVTSFTLELTHSSGTVTWPSEVKWNGDTAPTLTAGKTHLFMFVTDDGGSRYRGSALVDYVN